VTTSRLGVLSIGLTAIAALVAGTAGTPKHLPYGPGPKAHYAVQAQPPAGRCHYRHTASHQPLPDPKCTPGALNPKVTEATIGSTICKTGYTSKIRPPDSITEPEKRANAKSYSYKASLSDAEYDHLVPLELGGDPNDRRNLWVEPPSPGHKSGSGVNNPKDAVENEARSLVCAHDVGLTAMQNAIAANWTTAIASVSHSPPGGSHGPLSCSARVSDTHPAQYSTVVISVSTSGNASVVATAHYKTKDTVKTATANASGTAAISYEISRATKGYTVVVSIAVALKSAHASCSTSFTPA
jgi:hypothetical protein